MKVKHAPAIGLNSFKICWDKAKKAAFTRLYSEQVIKTISIGFMKKDRNCNRIYYSYKMTKY